MLSGGNQQKIVIARWLFADAELFILDEPTQGIDIGAKIAVYRLINELTAAGKGVILITSDHDELLAMSRPHRHRAPRPHRRASAPAERADASPTSSGSALAERRRAA